MERIMPTKGKVATLIVFKSSFPHFNLWNIKLNTLAYTWDSDNRRNSQLLKSQPKDMVDFLLVDNFSTYWESNCHIKSDEA